MKINAHRGEVLGTAVIEITGIPAPSSPDLVRFSILRQGHPNCDLGPQGWQAGEAQLTPSRVELLSGGVRLFLGPEVVDHMEQGNYNFKLSLGDAPPLSGGLGWRNIPPSPADARQNIKDSPPESPPPPKPAPPWTTPETPPPPPIGQQAAPPPPPGKAEISIDIQSSSGQTDTAGVQESTSRKGGLRWVLVAVVVLALAGGGWWFWKANSDTARPAAVLPPLAKARADLGQNINPEQALAAGKAMLGQAENADAAFLYLEYAAQAGQGEAALLLGRFFDPQDTSPSGSIIKSLNDAYEWYAKARDTGQAEAVAALAKLKDETARLAAQGDENAKSLLARWR